MTLSYGSYGLDQCLGAGRRTRWNAAGWARRRHRPTIGSSDEGTALGMIDTVPPFGHFADARVELRSDGNYG